MRWTFETAIACIKRNNGKVVENRIHHKQPGLKVLGAIDYLVNYCRFVWCKQNDKQTP